LPKLKTIDFYAAKRTAFHRLPTCETRGLYLYLPGVIFCCHHYLWSSVAGPAKAALAHLIISSISLPNATLSKEVSVPCDPDQNL
jgi:hypothetical protein